MPDARRKVVETIIGRSLLAAETIASDYRRVLLYELTNIGLGQPVDTFLLTARSLLDDLEPSLGETAADAEIIAWVAGADQVISQLPALALDAIEGPPRPPVSFETLTGGPEGNEPIVRFPVIERAAEALAERNIVTRDEFDQLGRDARSRAFTMAKEQSDEVIGRIGDTLVETIQEGASLETFEKNLGESLQSSFIGPGHLENVYRTNIQAGFHEAYDELADNPVVREIFPYQEYLPIRDTRVGPDHLALASLGLSGTGIYRRDDPMWQFFTPPWRYQCRCGVNLLTVEAAARKGVQEARMWDRTGQPPLVPEWRLEFIPFRPESDFVGGRRR